MAGPAHGEDQFGFPVEAVIASGTTIDAIRPNKDGANFKIVTVTNAGTPVQGPDLAVPDGFDLSVALRITQTGNPRGYVAESAADAIDASKRKEIIKGIPLGFGITNMNQLWFDANTNGTIFELVAEKAP